MSSNIPSITCLHSAIQNHTVLIDLFHVLGQKGGNFGSNFRLNVFRIIFEAVYRLNNSLTQFHDFSTMAQISENDYQ